MFSQPLEEEILDSASLDPAARERALRGLGRVNRVLFGFQPVRRSLLPLWTKGPPDLCVLDLGTGSGETAARLARAARRRGIAVRAIGVDRQLGHLLFGRRAGHHQLRVVADARHLPFADAACDWTLSSLFFHHFDGPANRAVVAEMNRVARRGAVVVDLRRNWLAALLVRLLLPLLGVCAVTRHDGRLSVRQSWPLAELRRWATVYQGAEVRRRFPFRFCLVIPTKTGAAGRAKAPGAAS
ncbi:MAG: methyltransferase domain-containing protein [Acidobacteriota bacterium]